ncbi:nickel transporter [Mycobacterium shimoidei]|uniref:Nickel/cobalt efflux system n=1 Tax=Mycobacterium shimoidei TaxID=29313 RepID=A0A1E3TJL9_MYCSH|nr:HoxN/HupN/NixA family nickel/cobalt transporter [Mycobacterium shimoidei]ODR14632.1 nickel transporter [Mycobacterium shimoidei]ORW80997.1 nickel transporter [Mycobacterium shimoidei]SRX93300.1 putative nickel transporter [Kitasatospora setae KM-6054] [Mycobacterium shimoidei]
MVSSTQVATRRVRLSWNWNRRDRIEISVLLGFVALIHLVGFITLIVFVAPHRYQTGSDVFGVGLGLTAYLFGVRHAFDADHIAAIDNTTRKLMSDGHKPKSVGFWFAMGHSTIVMLMAVMVVVGARAVGTLVDDGSPTRHALGFTGTLASALFLYLIAAMNIIAMVGITRAFNKLRRGTYSDDELEAALDDRGFLARLLRPFMNRIKRPMQIYPVGLLFGLGFDTATEIALLALAGTGAAAGLPWYAVLVLPVLFAAGMSLMDTMDGLLMTAAYDWAFMQPVRKIYYNLTVTGLSIAVAFLIGSIELVTILHDDLKWDDPVTTWVSGINLNSAGLGIVGLFAITWLAAIAYWKLAGVETRWGRTHRRESATADTYPE